MICSIATGSIGGALGVKLQTIAAAGFDAVEIFEPDFTCFDGSAVTLPRCALTLASGSARSNRFAILRECPNPSAHRGFAGSKRSSI